MTGEVIKSFLVGLGFSVDDSSLAKFNKSIASATLRVTALYGAVQLAGVGILKGISDISQGFEQMGYEYRIIAPAINKALVLRRELLKAYSLAGVNITKVIQNSVKLNMSLAKTKFAFKAIYDSVGSRFFDLITRQSDAFREKLYKNMPKIQDTLERLVKFIFKAIEATTTLALRLWSILSRVYDVLVKLDKATDGWSTILFAIIAAWKLLNLSFLATPLGMVLALGAALLALYDDYETFKEGGESLFDWSAAIPIIDAITKLVGSLADTLGNFLQILFAIIDAVWKLAHGDFAGFWFRIKLAAESFLDTLKSIWEVLRNVAGFGDSVKGFVSNLFGNDPAAASQNLNPTVAPLSNPLGSNVQNSQTNQNVKQQTNINVMGSADANAVGKAVAGEQNRVNFDLTRNMKGAVR